MKETTYHYSDFLNSELAKRQRENSHYSLRAFGRDIGIHPSTLSLILKGKRRLPLKNLDQVVQSLELTPIQETLFRESLYKTKAKLDQIKLSQEYLKQYIIDENYYYIIAEWEHYAVLSLIETKNFKSSPAFIAKRFNLTLKRAKDVIKNLMDAELIELKNGEYVLKHGPLRTTEDITSKALQSSHLETLDLAKAKLKEVDVELRDFSSSTIAINMNKLTEAKTIIREFRRKLSNLLRDGDKGEVYQLAVQLFPLTDLELNKEN